jgi:hypothetical protein
MNSKFQIKTDSDKCKNKLNALKKDFKAYKFIMDSCSGFGLNGPNNDQVRDGLFRANRNCKKFKKNMNFEYYEAMYNLMSNSSFTGNMILSSDQLYTATNNISKKKKTRNSAVDDENSSSGSRSSDSGSSSSDDDGESSSDDRSNDNDDCSSITPYTGSITTPHHQSSTNNNNSNNNNKRNGNDKASTTPASSNSY